MRKIKVLVDSCSDLTGEILEKYNMDYGRMNTVYQEKQTTASLTWEFYSPQELYNIMRGGERVTTTQVPVEEFMRIFKLYLEQDYDIIYIGCSGKQSGSVNTGTIVARQLILEYPDARIACIDSLNASIGEGLVGIYAAKLVMAGEEFDTVVDKVNAIRNHVNEYVTVNTLEWLRKAGRCKASKAFFGNLMGVKPIIISDANGDQTPIKKAKGRANSLNEIVNLLAESIENPEDQTIYVCHADCDKSEVEMVVKAAREKIPCKDIETVYIGPIIGASVGPDAIGIFGFGKEITYKVAEE